MTLQRGNSRLDPVGKSHLFAIATLAALGLFSTCGCRAIGAQKSAVSRTPVHGPKICRAASWAANISSAAGSQSGIGHGDSER